MNNSRRQTLRRVNKMLDDIMDLLEGVKCDEEDALDNMPENLQSSGRYAEIEENVGVLNEICDIMEETRDKIEELAG